MKVLIDYLENNEVVSDLTIINSDMKTVVEQNKKINPKNVKVFEKSHCDQKYYNLTFDVDGVAVNITEYKTAKQFEKWVRKTFKKV